MKDLRDLQAGLVLLLLHRAALAAPLGPHGDLELRAKCVIHLLSPLAPNGSNAKAMAPMSPTLAGDRSPAKVASLLSSPAGSQTSSTSGYPHPKHYTLNPKP